MKAKDLLLQDAIETAIKDEQKIIKLKRIIRIETSTILLMILLIIHLFH